MSKMSLYKNWQTALGIDASEQEYNLEALINLTGHYTNNPVGAIDVKAAIQTEIETMPGYSTTLVGFWLLGYDMVANEDAANNQTVKDWSGFGNNGLRGNSATPNTSSPNGASFDGDDFVQVPYAANMATATLGAVTLGTVAAQSVEATATTYPVSQNNTSRVFLYWSDGRVLGYFSRYRIVASNRVLNVSEHYMAAGNGSDVNMYKNGALSNSTTAGTYNSDVNSQPLYIGRQASGNYFTGTISCVYMYINSAQDANAALINTTVNNILTILEGGV